MIRKKFGNRGVLLFETLLCIQILLLLLFVSHIEIVRLWRERIEKLQESRIPYDGENKWSSLKVS
jgi:hypothetical protein